MMIFAEARIGGAVAYSPDVWGVVNDERTPEAAARKFAQQRGHADIAPMPEFSDKTTLAFAVV